MRNFRWLSLSAVVVLFLALAPSVSAQPPDPGILPPGLAVKVFIHYPKGHGQGTEVVTAPVCLDPHPAACDDYAIATTSDGKPIHWQDPKGGTAGIPYYVLLNYKTKRRPSLTADDARAAIDASFVAWEMASDAGLNYTNKGTVNNGTIPRLDGKNVVGWKALQTTWIAVTYVWYYPATGYIAEFDMIFNNNYAWSYTLPAPSCTEAEPYCDPSNQGVAGTFDVRDIGTHEAGHTLMLNDLYDPSHFNLTMYGYGAYQELKKDTLALGDDLGVDTMY